MPAPRRLRPAVLTALALSPSAAGLPTDTYVGAVACDSDDSSLAPLGGGGFAGDSVLLFRQ